MPNLEPDEWVATKRWTLIVWPTFLAAGLLEILVFSMLDPGEVHWPGSSVQPSRQSVYTIAFFCFWLIVAACSCLVLWLARPAHLLNDIARVD